jgi:hypothetical protein
LELVVMIVLTLLELRYQINGINDEIY